MANIGGLNLKIGGDISGAVAGLKTVQGSLAETAVSASKVDSTLDKVTSALSKVSSVAAITAKSFDEVSAEVFKSADAFNAKWNPVVAQAAQEAMKATTQIHTLADAVKKFGGGVNTFTSPLGNFNKGLTDTANSMSKLKLTAGTQTLTDFGRVIQDLPYGIIGVGNNITQLTDGFGRLLAQSKATGVGIGTTLLSALKGPAGIGLAISAVTTALTFANVGLRAWGISLGDSSKEADEAADSAKKLKTAIDNINSAAASELTKVKELVSGFEQENVSRREKIGIIKQLTQINPEYFGQLSAEKTSVGELKTAYDNYNNSIQNSIKTKVLSKQLEDLVEKELKLRDAMDFTNKLIALRQGFKLKDQGGSDPQVEKQQAALNGQQQELNRNLQQQAELLSKINSLGGIDSIFKFSEPKAEKAKKEVETYTGLYRNLAIQLSATSFYDFMKPVQRVLDKSPGLKVPITVDIDKTKLEAAKIVNAYQDYINKHKPLLDNDEYKANLVKAVKDVRTAIGDLKEELFVSIGEGLGKLIGGANGKDIFGGLFSVLAKGLKTLGEFAIKMSALMTAIRKALDGLNPAVGFAAGVGLIALGSLIESKIPKLATGGIVTRPTNALIGENGPEAVIPLGRMQGMFNNGGSGTITMRVRGKDLIAVVDKQSLSNARNFGSNY